MVPVVHALGQVVLSKLFAGFFLSQLQKRLPFGMTAMKTNLLQYVTYGLSTGQADLPLLQPLKQCWVHSCVCIFKPASASDAQHKDSISLIDPCMACSEWNPSWKTSVWPWPLYCNSVPGCYRTSYSLGPSLWRDTILILKSSESSLPWGAMLNIQWSVWENCTQITKF